MEDGYGYNERLFSGGIRSKLHFARFQWFLSEVTRLNCLTDSVLELGCFDGKLIDFLPNKPSRYIGFDANWEGGLDIAKARWVDAPNFIFSQASSPDEMHLNSNDVFNIAVAMETLEHVPPQMVDGYLQKIAQHLNGYFFVTVPNEKGIIFLAKWLAKKIFSKDAQHYTYSELANATFGRMDLVARLDHKGFDYESLVRNIEKYFDVIDISGHPLGFLPHSFCFGIGIIAKSKV
jgi:2-polyprenyl-3-methyl-5-hydroxy-6-metoxy-1,4-benzoquinol methylase